MPGHQGRKIGFGGVSRSGGLGLMRHEPSEQLRFG
jgi:hypothetical protein